MRSTVSPVVVVFKVVSWQNLIPSFPWIVPHPGAIQRKEGIKFRHLTTLKTTGKTVERIGIVILLVGDNLKKFSLEDEKDFESGFAE